MTPLLSSRLRQPGLDRHRSGLLFQGLALVDAFGLVVAKLTLGSAKLLGDFGQGGFERQIDILVVGFRALSRKSAHLDIHGAAVGDPFLAEVDSRAVKPAEILARDPQDLLTRIFRKAVAEVDARLPR